MSKYINPILVPEYGFFGSTKIRWGALLSPIQATGYKNWDFLEYLARPVVDVLSLPVFLFDAAVEALNCCISLVKAIHLWASGTAAKAGHDKSDVRGTPRAQLREAKESFYNAVSAFVAAIINPILSILALITRAVASVGHAVVDLCKDNRNYRAF